jgi:hypothetical protein
MLKSQYYKDGSPLTRLGAPRPGRVAHICPQLANVGQAWCPRFARVGVPGEARLAGVTGLTWGSSGDGAKNSMSKRVALKYCGGCDPEFDRVELFTKVRAAAGDSIEWVCLDDRGFDTVLLIAGCEQNPEISPYRVISIEHDRLDAAAIVKALLSDGEPGAPRSAQLLG